MKLVTYGTPMSPRLGIVDGGRVVPVAALDADAPRDMAALIERWDRFGPRLADALPRATEAEALAGLRLLAPILRPPKILCLGLNYADHVRETGRLMPEHQTWFNKLPTAANGPGGPIPIPRVSSNVDYEAELVLVIGKRGKHVAPEAALDHVFGYSCGNDVSVRDWQNRTGQWLLGKSFDGHAVFGPWIVTKDEIADPQALGIRCEVDGETRQSSNTRELIFRIPDMIALVSQVTTLEPGDLIYTGTPSGVAAAMTPPGWLRPGQTVAVEIEGIGRLENPVVAEG